MDEELVELINTLVAELDDSDPEICFFPGDDAIFDFWTHVKQEKIPHRAVVALEWKRSPLWRDLDEYEGMQFGCVYFLRFDKDLKVPVRPSQRGLWLEG